MNRVGVVSYSFQYSIGLFTYRERLGERFEAAGFVEKTREAGGDVAQLFHTMVDDLSDDELQRLRRTAEELDVLLEVHGGGAQRPTLEGTMRRAKALGAKVVGCSFGMMMRPDKIATLAEWDTHLAECKARYAELLKTAAELDLKLGIENHLDLTIEELGDLVNHAVRRVSEGLGARRHVRWGTSTCTEVHVPRGKRACHAGDVPVAGAPEMLTYVPPLPLVRSAEGLTEPGRRATLSDRRRSGGIGRRARFRT